MIMLGTHTSHNNSHNYEEDSNSQRFSFAFAFVIQQRDNLGNPLTICGGLSSPLGPKPPKKSKRSLPGPPAPGPSRESGKVSSLEKVSKRSRKTFLETFSRLSGGPRARGSGRLFSDSFRVSGPEGPRDACKWSTGSQRKN